MHGISQPQGAGGSGPSGWIRALSRLRTANTLNFPANINGFGYLHLCGECFRNQEKLENNTRTVKAVKDTTWCFRKERKMFLQHNSSSPGLGGLRDLDIFTRVAPHCFGEAANPCPRRCKLQLCEIWKANAQGEGEQQPQSATGRGGQKLLRSLLAGSLRTLKAQTPWGDSLKVSEEEKRCFSAPCPQLGVCLCC